MKTENEILELLIRYVGYPTHTGTELENNNGVFFSEWAKQVPYFKENPDMWGLYPIKDDPLKRQVCYAMLKGEGRKTIVFIHHSDTVDTDDYGIYKNLAQNPYEVMKVMKEGRIEMDEKSREDLDSGEWLFGRGASDMKAGGTIQLSMLEEYSQNKDFKGNIIVLAVPDEENSSAGMRAGVLLLKELKEKHDLEYILMIDGEPHERIDYEKISVYDGSVGKIMPVVHVRGKLAHVGQVYKGLNPMSLLSEIIVRTELNPKFLERRGNTTTLAPTWLYAKDNKHVYDVSLPLSATGYMSVLTLSKDPKVLMEEMKVIAEDAFKATLERSQASLREYEKTGGQDFGKMDWEPIVLHFGELVQKVIAEKGEEFRKELFLFNDELSKEIEDKKKTRIDAGIAILEMVLENWSYKGPVAILALAPPYYPATSSSMIEEGKMVEDLISETEKYSVEKFNTEIEIQNYYTGISDLSYAMFNGDQKSIDYITDNMLLWGRSYSIPLKEIREIQMPVMNLGPWGKDLHKYTERINIKDLTVTIPELTRFVINRVLGN